jgi:actin-related protein 8
MEIVDIEGGNKTAPTAPVAPPTSQSVPPPALSSKVTSSSSAIYPGGFPIDVCFEASKLPLDVAIFNSARAAGGDDKIRKYLQAVLVIGGGALVPGMAHALESR